MRFVPNITVSYHLTIRPAGVPFDIDDKDAEEMRKYGTVEEPAKAPETTVEVKPVRKGGRQKKTTGAPA